VVHVHVLFHQTLKRVPKTDRNRSSLHVPFMSVMDDSMALPLQKEARTVVRPPAISSIKGKVPVATAGARVRTTPLGLGGPRSCTSESRDPRIARFAGSGGGAKGWTRWSQLLPGFCRMTIAAGGLGFVLLLRLPDDISYTNRTRCRNDTPFDRTSCEPAARDGPERAFASAQPEHAPQGPPAPSRPGLRSVSCEEE
jgi:hypothetical protein